MPRAASNVSKAKRLSFSSRDASISLVNVWRVFLAALSVFNAFFYLYILYYKSPQSYHIYLSFPYIFQVIWRSFFISEYVHRHTISSSPFNSPLVARLLAAIGEFCFGLHLSISLGSKWDSSFPKFLPCLLIPCFDFTGQVCATIGTALQHNGFFFVEGCLWTGMFGLCAFSAIVNGLSTKFWVATWVVSGAAMSYMSLNYCPMCKKAWDTQPHRPINLTVFKRGIYRALRNFQETHKWVHWKDEVLWQSLYFVLGPWCSMYFIVYG